MDRITLEYLIATAKESLAGIAIVVAFVVIIIWVSFFVAGEKTVESEILKGDLVGFHYAQSESGPGYPVFAVKLGTGKIITNYAY